MGRWSEYWVAFGVVGTLAAGLVGLRLTVLQGLPTGRPGAASEAMLKQMYKAACFDCWEDTGAVYWVFSVVVGGQVRAHRELLWDRERQYIQIREGDVDVQISLNTSQVLAYRGGLPMVNPRPFVQRALNSFHKDRYWVYPAASLEDGHHRRSGALYGDELALRIDFLKGSFASGDSFLWFMDDRGLPYGWRLWTRDVPFKGMWISFENWITLDTGAKVSTRRRGIGTEVLIKNLHGAYTFDEMEYEADPFELLAASSTAAP